MKKALIWTTIFLWMFGIFYYSNMTSKSSNTKSKNIIEKTIDITSSITKENPTKIEKSKIVNTLNFPFRKLSHIMEYLILSILLVYGIYLINKNIKLSIILSLIICITYASLDEIHQLYVEGRSGRIIDVFYDLIGIIIGIMIIHYYKNKKEIIK